MQIEYHKLFCPHLNQDFELKIYGHAGHPMVVFPSQDGRFFDFENWGMVDAVSRHIHEGTIKIFSLDGRDWESWTSKDKHPHEKAKRHADYDAAVLFDVLPFVRKHSEMRHIRDMILTGCSMGAYHAVNFFLRHPDVADTVIGLSGLYQMRMFVGDYMDDLIYMQSPIHYLANLTDNHYLELYRQSRIILCCGQGRWEEECLEDTRRLSDLLRTKGVGHWLDLWGNDVDHDWPWWRKQLPYFLDQVAA